MHSLLLPLADVFLAKEIILLVSVILVLTIPIVAIVMFFSFRHRREMLWHETARIALEKGQPIPAGPNKDGGDAGGSPFAAAFDPVPPGVSPERWAQQRRERKREGDLKGGLVLLGLGAALYLANRGIALPAFALIGIGAALVLSHLLTRNDDGHRGPPPA